MKKNGSYEKLQKHKTIFVEKRKWKSTEKSKYKEEYENYCKKRSGALLFMVMEGNFSRGSNYENRSVLTNILFGVPYLDKNHPKIKVKMNDSGLDLTEHARRKGEQAVGRGIRNEN